MDPKQLFDQNDPENSNEQTLGVIDKMMQEPAKEIKEITGETEETKETKMQWHQQRQEFILEITNPGEPS